MNEFEWLVSADASTMLRHLGRDRDLDERKLRLLACAWAGTLWRSMADERSRQAVAVAERFADGLADRSEMLRAFNDAREAWEDAEGRWRGKGVRKGRFIPGARKAVAAARAAKDAADLWWDVGATANLPWLGSPASHNVRCVLLREIFGNPFRPARADSAWLTWKGGTVPAMARLIYDDYRFDEMPVLADALQDAGCDNEDVLAHCRGGGHVRGCWVLDLLLGKS